MNRISHKTLWGIGDAIVIIVALVPVLWLASLSFKDPSTIADGSFLPQKWTLDDYRGIFQTSLSTRALVNSIGIAVIATVLAVVIGSLAAYAVARLRFPEGPAGGSGPADRHVPTHLAGQSAVHPVAATGGCSTPGRASPSRT